MHIKSWNKCCTALSTCSPSCLSLISSRQDRTLAGDLLPHSSITFAIDNSSMAWVCQQSDLGSKYTCTTAGLISYTKTPLWDTHLFELCIRRKNRYISLNDENNITLNGLSCQNVQPTAVRVLKIVNVLFCGETKCPRCPWSTGISFPFFKTDLAANSVNIVCRARRM